MFQTHMIFAMLLSQVFNCNMFKKSWLISYSKVIYKNDLILFWTYRSLDRQYFLYKQTDTAEYIETDSSLLMNHNFKWYNVIGGGVSYLFSKSYTRLLKIICIWKCLTRLLVHTDLKSIWYIETGVVHIFFFFLFFFFISTIK